jgi:hypothetical protein
VKFKPHFDIDIPRGYKPEERKAIASEIIDLVISRTENGKDKDNKNFAKYSKAYAKHKGQTNVDLTFSGAMLAALELIQEKAGKIRIGIEDESLLGRVEGNCTGIYGDGKQTPKPRNFLGIKKSDLDAILANYPLDDDDARAERVAENEAAAIVARDIVMRSGVDVEDN